MLENALFDFGKRMEMPDFSLNQKGLASLQVGELGFLNFETNEKELLLYFTFPAKSYDDKASERILALAHYNYNYPIPLFTGLFKDQYILLTRFKNQEVTAAALETAFQLFLSLVAKAEGK